MIIIPGLSQPLKAAGKRIDSWVEDGDKLMVKADSTVRRAACPRCLMRSSRLHGHYRRVVADSPFFGRTVTLAVEIRRFKCINDCCAQRTFCECIEPLAMARQRCTLRLVQGGAGAWLRARWPSGRSAGVATEHAGQRIHGDVPEPRLAPRAVLARRQAEPRGELATALETVAVADHGQQGRGGGDTHGGQLHRRPCKTPRARMNASFAG